jgi:glycosyltransferase involved in cell wall biosynthesis
MRILLVNHEYTITGASLCLLGLGEHLRQAGHQLGVFSIVTDPGPMEREYRARGFPIHDPAELTDFDLAICNTVASAPLVLYARQYVEVVWWLHEGDNGLDLILDNPGWTAAFAAASAIVFQNALQRDAIYRSFLYRTDPGKLWVIPNGVHVGRPARAPRDARRIRVVSIGSVEPRKRQGDLLRAAAAIATPEIECIFVGKLFQLEARALEIAKATPDRYRMLGELPNGEALAWLNSADIFSLVSQAESQPLTILEAALLRKPLILSDLPVYEDVWKHGVNCLLVPVGDVELLTHSLSMLATAPELRDRLGAAAAQTARRFTPEACFAKFDLLLHTVWAGGPR